MVFNWPTFLTARGIEFVGSGKDNIAIHCPWCGTDDPSQHLAISLEGKGWRCYRRREHRGQSNAYLVAKLLRCSMEDARSITGQRRVLANSFGQIIGSLLEPAKQERTQKLAMPTEFKEFRDSSVLCRPYSAYLKKRGFAEPERVARTYGLRYCREGPFHGRIIFPVYDNEYLVGWTGRAISNRAGIRYRALSEKEDWPLLSAPGPITNYLLWYDELMSLWDADTIVLAEGPFDSLKLNYLGERCGVVSTCFFTTSPSPAQIALLHELLPRYKKRVLLQDRGAYAMSLRTTSDLISLGVENVMLPTGVDDPGKLNAEAFEAFMRSIGLA